MVDAAEGLGRRRRHPRRIRRDARIQPAGAGWCVAGAASAADVLAILCQRAGLCDDADVVRECRAKAFLPFDQRLLPTTAQAAAMVRAIQTMEEDGSQYVSTMAQNALARCRGDVVSGSMCTRSSSTGSDLLKVDSSIIVKRLVDLRYRGHEDNRGLQ